MTNAIIITFIIFILNNYYKLINCQNCTYENIENNIRYFDNSVLFINKNSMFIYFNIIFTFIYLNK